MSGLAAPNSYLFNTIFFNTHHQMQILNEVIAGFSVRNAIIRNAGMCTSTFHLSEGASVPYHNLLIILEHPN